MLRLEVDRNAQHLAPAPQLHHPVGAPLRRALRQRQPAGLLEDRPELARLDVDGRAMSFGDRGKRRAAEICPRRGERHVVIDGDGHNPGIPLSRLMSTKLALRGYASNLIRPRLITAALSARRS